MNKKLISLLTLLIVSLFSFATSLSIKQTLINSLSQYVDDNEPGCALAYGNPSKDIFHASGVTEVGNNSPIKSTTPFLMASTSKQFTAHLAMLLAKQNLLALEGEVQQYFPELDSDEAITVRDLMNHTSGIADHWSIFELQGRSLTQEYRQQDALTLLINNLALGFKPGMQFKYSNGGYLALTQVIEQASNQTLNELLNQQINRPLNINAQYLDEPKKLPKLMATGHMQTKSGFKPYTGQSYIYGDGNLMINALDFSKWAKYLNQQVASMPAFTKALSTSDKHNNYFAGLYIERDSQGRQFLQHSGYYENYTQSIVLIPESQEYALALCNRADFRPSKMLYNVLAEIGSLNFKEIVPAKSADNNTVLKPSLYINAEKNDIAMVILQEGELYYYGQLVSSPKLLKPSESNLWQATLSTSKIAIEPLDEQNIQVSNRQNTYIYKRLDTIFELPFKALPEQTYTNPTIGKVQFSFAQNGRLNFINSVGEIPLTCNFEKICWSEEGYVVVRIKSDQEIIISTNDLKTLSFTKQSL